MAKLFGFTQPILFQDWSLKSPMHTSSFSSKKNDSELSSMTFADDNSAILKLKIDEAFRLLSITSGLRENKLTTFTDDQFISSLVFVDFDVGLIFASPDYRTCEMLCFHAATSLNHVDVSEKIKYLKLPMYGEFGILKMENLNNG